MFKLGRSAFSAGKITDSRKEADAYPGFSLDKIGAVFAYLQSVAYNYPINDPPKMDRSIFSKR